MTKDVDDALEEDLEKDVDDGIEYRILGKDFRVKIIGRKPFALNYLSLINDEEDEKENIENVISALENEDFKRDYPKAAQAAQDIVSILNAYRSDAIDKSTAKNKLAELQNNEKSYKTRARLAQTLSLAGNCSYTVELRKVPDMSWLIPQYLASNFYQRDIHGNIITDSNGKKKSKKLVNWKRNRTAYENMPTDPKPEFKDDHYNSLVQSLTKRRAELESQVVNQGILDFYDLTIAAYRSGDWNKITSLNGKISTMDHITAAFDIKNHTGFYFKAPDYYLEGKTLEIVPEGHTVNPVNPVDPVVTMETLNGYTSDDWKQLIDGAKDDGYLPIFLQMTAQSLELEEGIEISALREVLDDKFPKDFNILSKEEKEAKIKELRNNLNSIQLAKFNIKLSEDSLKLAEMLPPHQLVVMAQNIDETLKKK
ncbi:MAG: hypothetical protein MJ210_00820 [Alphaproteobacteria bacterium]|nr:hypothetical protein [Alphaproteobacteria bacterium]